jgi:hypothetical protein
MAILTTPSVLVYLTHIPAKKGSLPFEPPRWSQASLSFFRWLLKGHNPLIMEICATRI